MKTKWIVGTVLLLLGLVSAADFKKARIVDAQDISEVGGGVIDSPPANGVSVSTAARVPSAVSKFELTVELDGRTYTAVFPQDRHFQMTDLVRGQFIPVRLEGKKLALQRPFDGKEVKGKIVREEEAQPESKK